MGKIKDVITLSKSVERLNSRIDRTESTLDNLDRSISLIAKNIDLLSKELMYMKNSNKKMLSQFEASVSDISELNAEFKKSIYDIAVFKKDALALLLKNFEEGLSKELKRNLDALKLNSSSLKALRKDYILLSDKTKEVSKQVEKIILIGKRLKVNDFNMVKYMREISKADKEKLSLMKKIDSLERLISRLRRSH